MKIIKRQKVRLHPQLIYKIWEAQDKAYENVEPEPVTEILKKARKELKDQK